MNKENNLENAIQFLYGNESLNALLDHVSEDLKINIDYECSKLYDMVQERFINVSFEDIIEKTIARIIIALESFEKGE